MTEAKRTTIYWDQLVNKEDEGKTFPCEAETQFSEFDGKSWNIWKKPSQSSSQRSKAPSGPIEFDFTILTHNVLFDVVDENKFYTDKRIPLIIDEIIHLKPDIVGLQEVTQSILQYIKDDDIIRKNYLISDIEGKFLVPYGTMVLIKKKKMLPEICSVFRFSQFKQSPNICFLLKNPRYNGELKSNINTNNSTDNTSEFGLNNAIRNIIENKEYNNEAFDLLHFQFVHLTAGDKHGTRRTQMNLLSECSNLSNHVIVAGDFNYSDEYDDIDVLQSYNDCWTQLHNLEKEPGYTYDPENNLIAKMNSRSKIRRRLDRIYYKSKGNFELKCKKIEIVGTEKFSFIDTRRMTFKGGVKIDISPSDHFGLFSTFTLKI